jgi:hypothetical protein
VAELKNVVLPVFVLPISPILIMVYHSIIIYIYTVLSGRGDKQIQGIRLSLETLQAAIGG